MKTALAAFPSVSRVLVSSESSSNVNGHFFSDAKKHLRRHRLMPIGNIPQMHLVTAGTECRITRTHTTKKPRRALLQAGFDVVRLSQRPD
jgi:hypothetical protein